MESDFLEKLALLKAMQDMNEKSDDNYNGDDGELYLSSIADAEILLNHHLGPNGSRFRKKLIDYVTDRDNGVLSECDLYHNFIMDLLRMKDCTFALKVCDCALEVAPYNCDILGDAIKCCGDSSQFSLGEKYLERAMQIPREKWSQRLFLYSVDFMKTKLKAFITEDELYQRALELVDDYITKMPFDEMGYNKKAELKLIMNEREEAISLLKKYIFEVRPDENDSHSELICAQCCVTLLNILDDNNDYDLIIQICDKGLLCTTQEQPSANIGFLVYRKALAYDAKAHKEEFRSPDTISNALKFYQSAYDLNQDREFCKTIEKRYAVLRAYTNNAEPLKKRSLYKDETDNTVSSVIS